MCINSCGVSRIDAFLRSDQNRCASKLLAAYTEGDVEEIKRIAQSSTISHLDHVVGDLVYKFFWNMSQVKHNEYSLAVDTCGHVVMVLGFPLIKSINQIDPSFDPTFYFSVGFKGYLLQ